MSSTTTAPPDLPPLSSTTLSQLDPDAVCIAHDDGEHPTSHQIQLGNYASQVSLFGRGDTDGEQMINLRAALLRAVDLLNDRIDLLGIQYCGAESGYHDGDAPITCQRDDGHDGDHAGHGITWAQGWHAGLTDQPESESAALRSRDEGQQP